MKNIEVWINSKHKLVQISPHISTNNVYIYINVKAWNRLMHMICKYQLQQYNVVGALFVQIWIMHEFYDEVPLLLINSNIDAL